MKKIDIKIEMAMISISKVESKSIKNKKAES